jgi:hypothetical protein
LRGKGTHHRKAEFIEEAGHGYRIRDPGRARGVRVLPFQKALFSDVLQFGR